MGLSRDPDKQRRQLESLKRGAEARVATLQARIEALPASATQPRSIEDPGPSTSEAAIEAPIEDPIEDRAGATIILPPGRIGQGSYGPLPAVSEPAIEGSIEVEADGQELELEDVIDDGGDVEGEPGAGLRFAAGALGVGRRRRL